jgi:hypothetical protein
MMALIMSTACMNKESKKPKKVETKERAPKKLVMVLEELDRVLSSVDKIEETSKLSQMEFESLQTKTEKKEGKSKEDKDEKKETEDKVSNKDIELTKQWKAMDSQIDKIHRDWNSYEIESRKKGASTEKGKEFKHSLNYLTTAVENRKTSEIVDATSKSILALAYYFDLYKDDINGDLSRIKHVVLQAYLNPDGGKELLDKTEDYVLRLRQKLEKDKAKLKDLDKLSLSIKDMEQSLKENSDKLLGIKKDIILKNIDSLKE